MSWSGFKKNVGRATTQVMMKTGHVERTSDREYEVEERRYRTLESASLRLQKEAKGYLDSLRAMTASQMRIAETIDAFYGDSGAKDGVSRSYKQAVEDLDAETVKALDGPYRCVPDDLRSYCWDEELGLEDEATILQIEREMNYETAKTHTATLSREIEEYGMLMDYVYRTTVLEPINRFCAYFPDINECIKKRNHKMLDYDAMRAKVKKLVEKPDKDPAKLPRTEKETEMVSFQDFLLASPPSARRWSAVPARKPVRSSKAMTASVLITEDDDLTPDLTIPSPPKALNGIYRPSLTLEELPDSEDLEASVRNSMESTRSVTTMRRESSLREKGSNLLHRMSSLRSPRLGTNPYEAMLQRRKPYLRSVSAMEAPSSRVLELQASGELPSINRLSRDRILARNSLQPSSLTASASNKRLSMLSMRSTSTARRTPSFISTTRSFMTPMFEPSELEDIMGPLRLQYIEQQTDLLRQAKVAYEQLNEQLTNELPQLIDLRVPYLDPSFEALVKIQLRFCAEAYSRMAQVQQYLDASTRDQYASGDLDARVEDVLGQIRELTIAGTV